LKQHWESSMANEREFINSFQGKNIDSAELQNLDNNSYFDIVSRYNVSDDGVLTSKIKPRYNNSFNNPAPEDPSRFDPPPPDPIRITRPDALDVPASTLEYSTLPQSEIDKLQRIVINPGREYETNSRYGDRGRFEQFDAPEENIDSADIAEATFDLANYSSKNSGGVLGPPIGLNESAKLKKTIVFITHDLDESLRLGDHIGILNGGRLVQAGTPEEIIMSPADDYVEAFVKDVNRAKVLKAKTVMIKANEFNSKNLKLADVFKVDESSYIEQFLPKVLSDRCTIMVVDKMGDTKGYITEKELAISLSKDGYNLK